MLGAMTERPPRLYRMIEARLDGTLIDFVAQRRASQSWRAIAEEVWDVTGIEVSDDSLRRWFANRITVEVKVA